MTTRLSTDSGGKVTRQAIGRFLMEAALLVGAMLAYWLMRGAIPERIAESFSRTNDIIRLEERLGIFVEPRWQQFIIDNLALVKIANWIYLWAHLPLLIAGGIWIYLRSRERYRVYRNALLISAAAGLFFYTFFPVAPPRMLPEWGFVDTIVLLNPENYNLQPSFLVNHYAAVPSLHVGWALLIGIALFDVDRRVPMRAFALLLPTAMFFSVVLTANHFILDVIIGTAIVVAAIAIAFALDRRRQRQRPVLEQQT